MTKSLNWDPDEVRIDPTEMEEFLRTHGPAVVRNFQLQEALEGKEPNLSLQAQDAISNLKSH